MDSQLAFQKLKAVCVPLLPLSDLKPSTTSQTTKALADLIDTLHAIQKSGGPSILNTSLASYTFFPLSTILRRNELSAIPSKILIKLLTVLDILCDAWWWDCDIVIWEQCFMLCGAIIGGVEGKGKGKERDDETKEFAAKCLWTLMHERTSEECQVRKVHQPGYEKTRTRELCAHAQSKKMLPIVGQTLNTLLTTSESKHRPLQMLSLQILEPLLRCYAPSYLLPSVLPGVVSSMSKVALGISLDKGWSNGDVVEKALAVMQEAILQSISDDICIKEGAINQFNSLESLSSSLNIPADPSPSSAKPYATTRTSSWLRATASQLHIALNNLTSLVSHTNPAALMALSRFAATIIEATPLALPQTQPLLLSFLLSLSNSTYPSISSYASEALLRLLKPPSKARTSLLHTIISTTQDNLSALPRLIPTHADAKVEHLAGLIDAVCRIAVNDSGILDVLSVGLGKILGPTGGIEKWGWGLLSSLEFINPAITISQSTSLDKLIENDAAQVAQWTFPDVQMKYIASSSAQTSLTRMLKSLGRAAGDRCLFSVEWFINVGRSSRGKRVVSALWCACRLLEGIGNINLDSTDAGDTLPIGVNKRSPRLDKVTRGLAKSIAELWDDIVVLDGLNLEQISSSTRENPEEDAEPLTIEYSKGLSIIKDNLNIGSETPAKLNNKSSSQPILHQCLALQILAVTSGILQSRFPPLLLQTIYPILRSIVSPDHFLSATGLATLHFITVQCSYASAANLLLSNFDYALDAVSRRLNRRWLDVDAAPKAMVLLVRLVGRDIVDRAGDVVDECFDRLDDYHGYDVIVEGLIEVLNEVVKVIEVDEEPLVREDEMLIVEPSDKEIFEEFCQWFKHRRDPPEKDETDYGPAPREACGPGRQDSEDPDKEGAEEDYKHSDAKTDPSADLPPTSTQALTKQIITRSLYFLTHGSPSIRARILSLLSSSVPVLPSSALLPSIHNAWPFILNRLVDREQFVVSAASFLVEALATHVGSFMSRRVWGDVWPRFRTLLTKLEQGDSSNALSRHGPGGVGTESAYTHSHRTYRSLIKTMTAAMSSGGLRTQDAKVWEVIMAFRRFLHVHAHEELQKCARELYVAIGRNNADAVWLALESTNTSPLLQVRDGQYLECMKFMRDSSKDIAKNVGIILQTLDST